MVGRAYKRSVFTAQDFLLPGEKTSRSLMEEKKPEKHEIPSWDYIYDLCVKLADQIRKSEYRPDLLIAISRGGWIPGRVLSDLLNNANIASIRVEYYLDIYQTLQEPKITQPLPVDVSGKRILLIDDVADSGKSLKAVHDYLLEHGAGEVKICALYRKPWSIVVPDFFVRETDAWIWFPHEVYETTKKVYSRLKGEGKSREEIERRLVEIGIKSELVKKFLSWIELESA